MNEQIKCERPGSKSLPLRGRWHGKAVTEGVLRRPAEPLGTPSVSLRLTAPSEREPLEAVNGTLFTRSITLSGFEKSLDFSCSPIRMNMGVQKVGDEVSPRTGRPKVENPLNVDLKVRFDQSTNSQLLAYCEKHGVTRTEAIRRGIRLLLEQEK